MMDEFVIDTHSLLWYLTDSPRLGAAAAAAFESADNGEAIIHIPAIVLAELYYVIVKFRISIDFADTYHDLESSSQFVLTPLEPSDTLDFQRDELVTEMHDRIIVGLARRLRVPLITVDGQIALNSPVAIVWQ